MNGKFKLAGIDVDGTLLGPDLKISPENLQALRLLNDHKIEIVIASGRHYLGVAPFLTSLPEVRWLVSFQGAEVSDRDRKLILARTFMDETAVEVALDQARRFGLTPIVYGTDGVFTDLTRNDNLAYYHSLSALEPVLTSRENLPRIQAFKVLGVGEASQITAGMADPVPGLAYERVQTHCRIVEFMPKGVTKATGLQRLAAELNISPKETVVFGDGDNDIPMFKWAGYSVAMAHGWPAAIESASQTSPTGPPETALARAINAVVAEFVTP
jgi:Cof subfamily protein (haloacid dehalogenase superfamily)